MSLNESQMSLNKRKSGQMSLNYSIFESASTRQVNVLLRARVLL